MWEYQYSDELMHYGVLGMRWGVRRAKNPSTGQQIRTAKAKFKKAKNDAFEKYEKEINRIEKPYKKGQILSKKDQDRSAQAGQKYTDSVKSAKSIYKQTVKDIKASKQESSGKKIAKSALKTAGTVGIVAATAYVATAGTLYAAAKSLLT